MSETNITVLVVEDDDGHANLIKRAFRDAQNVFNLDIVGDLKQARDYLNENTPDIVVTDLLLPDGRGSDLLTDKLENVPFPLVVMTSFGDEGVAVEAMKGGALDYIVKSAATLKTMPRVVKRVLREWGHIVKRREAEAALIAYNDTLEEAVRSRTRDLKESYERLQNEVLERKKAQVELDRYKNQLEQLVEERTQQLETLNRRFMESNRKLEIANKKLERLANFDALTGVPNRRHFMEALENEWKRSRRNVHDLALIMIDVDFFKDYNDHYGHQAGDQCLVRVATLLLKALPRTGDTLARYGGEEFVVILPDTDRAGAGAVAEKLRVIVQDAKIPHQSSPIGPHVTVSMGYASVVPAGAVDISSLIADADKALYEAKRRGRNRCEYR